MSQTICILGRQPALGLAELESLLGAEKIIPNGNAALVGVPAADIPLWRMGGTQKVCKLLTFLPTTDWAEISEYLAKELPQHVGLIPEGKIRFGLNVIGLNVSTKRLNATGLELKKVIKQAGRSVRLVPNNSLELNAAQTIHNQLTGPTGLELVLLADKNRTILAQAVAVQDIGAYAARDQKRPMRDARVGMLPPKLAQIIINMANPQSGTTVLDPFCGTGVLLQEALLMGYNAYGTDLEPRMVEYSNTNLDWLNITSVDYRVSQGDATNATWDEPVDAIAAETYLGRPFSTEPRPEKLREVMQDVDTIHKKFLHNVARQTPAGFRICIAVPAWFTAQGVQHLKTLASLEEMGYTRLSFVHAKQEDLVYHREGQIVGRELVVLIRK